MINKLNKLLKVHLSKDGKNQIKEWLIEEFGSMYYAQKQLDTDEAIIDFVNDMLLGNNMKLQDLGTNCNITTSKKKNNVVNNSKHFKYCPYCGEYIYFDMK